MLKKLSQIIGQECVAKYSVGGGCVAQTYRVKTAENNSYFVKKGMQNSNALLCEANGLRALAATQSVCVPQVIFVDEDLLVLEYISSGIQEPDFFENFGEQLALMHKNTATYFGFFEDNFIGNTLQINTQTPSWEIFYIEYRLRYQLDLLKSKGLLTKILSVFNLNLEEIVTEVLAGSEEPPALLHGDLWSGNYMANEQGSPCIFDPAVYYGHREAELAMTQLFGGFPSTFYRSYEKAYPLKQGWEKRQALYKLYHILNHINLFGSSYLQSAESIVKSYQ